MKKILKKLLVSLLAVSVIVSSSAFVFADETADTEQIQLFSEGTNVVKAYDGSETINLANYPKFGLIFETNSTDVPFKGESDVSFKYSGVAESTGWNLKNENHGQNGFTLDSNAIKSINTNKMIFEMDILPMNDNNGISLRFIPNGSSSSYTAGGMFMSGKALVTGEWNKIVYVIGNKETDKTYEIYINGALVSSGTSAGYGSTGSNHKIYPHAADNAEIEMYIDNIKIIAADSYEGSASSTIASLDENITVEGNKISGIPYGTTAEELKNTLVPEDGTDIFVGNEKYRNAASDAVIENGYKIASVSADGMYTYYTAEVEYIPGDIYQKIIVKKNSLTDVSVSNISGIADSALLIYKLKDNAVDGKIYTYYLNNRENDIVCSFEEPAESMDDIKVILINNASSLASSVPADNTVKIELAVESGVTVSGTAVADTPVSLIILSPDADFKASEFLTDTAVEDVYYAAGTNSGDDSAFTFDTVGFRSSGIYTYLIYKDGRFYTQEMFAPGTQAVINFKTGLETLATPQDLKALLDADSVTGDTGLVYDYYNELSTSEQLTLCEEIIKSMNLYEVADVNLDEFADELKYRSMIPAMVKESDANVPADRVFELLDVDNPVFNLSGSAVEAYKEMSETEQRAVCEYVCKNPDLVTNPETLQAILNVSVINTKLDNVITHSNVYDILKAYADALDGLDFTTYSKLTTEQQTVNMGIIGKKPFETPESLINAANDLIEDAEETEEDNEDDGKKSSSGGSSKRGRRHRKSYRADSNSF